MKAITPDHFPWFDYSRYSFSLGVQTDPTTAYLSGHSASRYDTEQGRIVVDGDAADQTRTAYAKIEAILGAAGLDFGDVVRVVENVTRAGIDQYAAMEAVRQEVLAPTTPAVSTVVVDSLLRPAALVEIEVTARRGGAAAYAVDSNGRASFAPAAAMDDTVFLSTIHPYDEQGDLVGDGDSEEQVRQIFRNAARILAACGLTTADIVKTVDMVRPEALATYKYTGRPRREFLGPVYPGAAGILQTRVAADDRVLVSYDIMASRAPARAINPGWERYSKLTYSPAVVAGSTVFMSGQASLDPETERALHAGDVAAQAEYVYGNIALVLEAADLDPSHLVKTIEYVTPEGLAGYRGVAGVRKALFSAPFPASTGIICHSLLRPEFLLEVDPMAIVPAP